MEQVVPEMASIGERCLNDGGLFGQLQEVVKFVNREIGTKFWAPFGRTLVRRRLHEAAEQKVARKAAEERTSGPVGTTASNIKAGGHPESEAAADNASGATPL